MINSRRFLYFGLMIAIAIGSVAATGCEGPVFTNVGNGVGVPVDHIDSVANDHNLSREDAARRIREEIEERDSR